LKGKSNPFRAARFKIFVFYFESFQKGTPPPPPDVGAVG